MEYSNTHRCFATACNYVYNRLLYNYDTKQTNLIYVIVFKVLKFLTAKSICEIISIYFLLRKQQNIDADLTHGFSAYITKKYYNMKITVL